VTWQRLARVAGIGLVLLLGSAAAGFRDVEAAALAVGVIVALGLQRFRTGLLGLLALGALCADVAAWMAPGAISNLTHREPWIATALPSALAVVALTGLAAVAALLIARRRSIRDGGGPVAVAVIALLLIVATNVAGAVAQSDRGSPVRPGDIAVTAQHVKFSPETLEANSGAIGVTVGNLDLFWHTFTIRSLDVDVRVPVQAERRITFRADRGTYEFVCTIPGHTQAGMKGKLVVR
jgi:nitrite reductase (NO-forming)